MKKLFDNFFSINVGHVALVLVFSFGLGISWQKNSDDINRFRVDVSNQANKLNAERQTDAAAIKQEVLNLHAVTIARTESMRAERELKLQIMGIQIQATETRIASLEQERTEQRIVGQRLSAVEAKLASVEEVLRAINKKL